MLVAISQLLILVYGLFSKSMSVISFELSPFVIEGSEIPRKAIRGGGRVGGEGAMCNTNFWPSPHYIVSTYISVVSSIA